MKKIKVQEKTNDYGVFEFWNTINRICNSWFAMSWMGTNLTAFLGPLSQFTPLAAGLVGAMFLNLGIKVNKSSIKSPVNKQGI